MTTEKKNRLINAKDWAEMRPYMVMIHIDHWSKIKLNWKEACRYAGPDCNVTLNSVDKVIQSLDSLIKEVTK